MLWEYERYGGLGMDALVSVCSRNTNVTMVWTLMLWSAYALGTPTLLRFGHGRFDQRMLWEYERYYGLGMDALISACSGNTNVMVVWAWMLWSAYALGTPTLLWFGHGCFGQCMFWEHERYDNLGMEALLSVCSGNTNVRYSGLGLDALVSVCSRNICVIVVWAWMLWSAYALGAFASSWFGHGGFGQRMLSEHTRYHGSSMDASVSACSRDTNDIMDATRRLAAIIFSPKFYTLDPKA